MMAQVAAGLASHLAAGGLLLAGVLSLFHRLPAGFLRFCSASSALLAAFAAIPGSSTLRVRLAFAGLSLVAFVWYVTLARGENRRPMALLAAAAAILVLVLTAGPGASTATWVAIVSSLSAALLLGAVAVTMILGHWYLVIPSLPVTHLQNIVKVHMASMVVRIAVVAAAVFVAIATWEPGLGPNFRQYVFSVSGVFFWQRVLFGLVGPALLSYMTWETAKIRSTQSATGILYVAAVLVIVGEGTALALMRATGLVF
ncbi:MAG TPA: hypothetical protein VIG29_08150 [Vicinamibacteria bacterium]